MLEPDAFNAFLNEIGQEVSWRRARACPCVNPSSGQAKVNCKHCLGRGKVWSAPTEAKTGVAGGSVQKRWFDTGLWAEGDKVVSVPSDSPLYEIGPFDRVVFMNSSEPFTLNIIKGVNEQINWPVLSLEAVLYLDPETDELVDAPPPLVLPCGTLDWGGVELPDGVTFSLTGRRRAEYYCYPGTPWDRPHHAGAALPRRVVLRRFDLMANS